MRSIRLSCLCLLGSALITSCVKQSFDTPPDSSTYDPKLAVTATLGDLASAGMNLNTGTSRLLGDTVVYGIVIGDDRSGNLYKKIVIEDTAGNGMSLIIDKTYLYGDYPVGRKIYLKTNGLYITNYKGVPEITYSVNADGSTNGIPSTLISNFIVKGDYPHIIAPVELTLTQLYANPQKYINTLITLDNMQFDNGSAGVLYSAPTSSTNRYITNCDHTVVLTMYNSNYATFQSATTPKGNGPITGIATVFISTPEFILRDTTDIVFTGTRCP